jgi:hypothetical protein
MKFDWRRLKDPAWEKNDNKRHRLDLTAQCMDDEATRQEGKRICKTNLYALCLVLGYCLVDEEVHKEAFDFFLKKDPSKPIEQQHIGQLRRGSLLLPRGVYKTTISLVNCAQLIACFPLTVAIMVMCGNRKLAEAFVDQIASFFIKPRLAAPTLFQVLFSELCIERQETAGEFTAAQRQTDPEIIEPAIWATSIESGNSGWHPNILVVDDAVNDRNSGKLENRQNITRKYKMARKTLVRNGLEFKIGTIYGSGDVFSDEVLTTRPGTYRRVIKPAMRLLSGERIDQNGFPEEDAIELLFPTILDYDYLREEYESGFESFVTQFMLDEFGASEIVFTQQELLEAMKPETEMPLAGKPIVHWRMPCKSKRWTAAYCAVGVIDRNRCYIVDAYKGFYRPSELAKLIVEVARHHHTHDISIEDSPGAILMQSAIQNEAMTVGWLLRIAWKDFEEDTGDRDTRIRNIETLFPATRLIFSDDLKPRKEIIREFQQYGMIDDNGFPDVVARVAGELPQSIAADPEETEAEAWQAYQERDRHNLIFGRGPYAAPEPEPEERPEADPAIEDQQYNANGLEVWIPGLE